MSDSLRKRTVAWLEAQGRTFTWGKRGPGKKRSPPLATGDATPPGKDGAPFDARLAQRVDARLGIKGSDAGED